MLKVGVYGGSGYTGQELLRLLIRHPDAEVVATTSRRFKGMAVSDVYPVFEGMTSLKFVDARPEEMVGAADSCIFRASPRSRHENRACLHQGGATRHRPQRGLSTARQ